MQIRLHIGAHKTASTYMQSKLMEDREKLAEAKTGVVAHNFFRRQISEPLDAAGGLGGVGFAVAKPALARALAKMVKFHAAQDRVVMSDENVAGPIMSGLGASGLYPDVRRRLAVVLDAMPRGHETTVFFCVRNYAQYFSSIYAYRAGMRKKQEVEAFRRGAMELRRGWADVVSDICEVAGAERVVVWSYEEFAKRPGRINVALLGDEKPRVFVKSDKASLPSLSRKGLAVLDRVADMLSEQEHAGLARVIARYKFEAPDEKFSLFSPAEVEQLSQRYREELEGMSRLGCELLVFGPPPAKSAEEHTVALEPLAAAT